MVRGVGRISDRYRVLVVGCLWRGGVSAIKDERLSTVDCSIKSNIVNVLCRQSLSGC